MTLDEYQQEQQRTANLRASKSDRLSVACLGLAGESGEVCDHVKKWLGQGHELDRAKVAEEAADVLWYVSEVASVLGLTLSELAGMNVAKLRARFPEGFDADRSRNRPASNSG